jgi:uncharacterized protein YceK
MKRLFVGLMVFAAGCSSVGTTYVSSERFPAREKNCSLDVYMAREDVKREYAPICILDSDSGTSGVVDRSITATIRNARPYACQCGGDGLLVIQATSAQPGFWTSGSAHTVIQVIKYK